MKKLIEVVKKVTENVPSHHGFPHLIKVAEIAYYIAVKMQTNPVLAFKMGLTHDLRWWDEDERKIRKIAIPDSAKVKVSPEQILKDGGVSGKDIQFIMDFLPIHNKLFNQDEPNESPTLYKVVRDADKLSRMGYQGLLSILEANQFYGEPFLLTDEKILWNQEMPLMRFEDIKSAVSDSLCCLTWWNALETAAGKTLFLLMSVVNQKFHKLVDHVHSENKNERLFKPLTELLEKILFGQRKERVTLFDNKCMTDLYEKNIIKLENPKFLEFNLNF